MISEPVVLRNKIGFREDLVQWFSLSKEDYPWRRTTDPWAILVSEVMLQQTQVATVIGKGFYVNFLRKFPDVNTIATASEQEILKAWEGLGYYSRVRNLQKTAQAIVTHFDGDFPSDYKEILALPGIGPYTAGAVSSFAFMRPVELVDANVARVFSRVFNYEKPVDSAEGIKQLWQWARELLDVNNPAAYNSALMELGQKICRNKSPDCLICPIRSFCETRSPELLPIKKPKKKQIAMRENCGLCIKDGKILLQRQQENERRAGMWTLPIIEATSISDEEGGVKPVYQASYFITHYKVDLRVYAVEDLRENETRSWVNLGEVESTPIPSPFRKALNRLLK